ncbi:MAG: glycosyltransferase family 4 protein [Armatimonadota bacterium]
MAFVGTHPGLPRLLTGRGPETVGGAELQLSLLAKALAARGHDVAFGVGGYDGVTEAHTPEGIRVLPMYRVASGASWARPLVRPTQLMRGLARLRAGVYLVMGAGAQAGLTACYCRMRGKRFVFWLASDTDALCHVDGLSRTPRSERWLALRGLTWAHAIVAQTQEQARLVREKLGRDATVIGNIWPYRIELRPPGAEPYALWVSNIRPEKRPEMLLDIAKALPEVAFTMIGGPVRGYEPLYEQIRSRAEELSNVRFMGYVPFEETHRWFADAALFVNTSAVEGFPNTYLQAWAAGKPVVGSFDPDGLLAERGLGRYFRDVPEAVGQIAGLLGDEAACARIGQAALRYVQENHSEQAVVARLEELLVSGW